MLKPSNALPAVTINADPVKYHLLGSEHRRGDPRKVMSRGELRKFASCPRRWIAGVPDEPSDAMAWGSLLDCIVLTPERFTYVYEICPDTYRSEGKRKGDAPEDKPWNWNATVCKEWRATKEADGKMIVKSDDASDAWLAAKRLEQDPHILAFLAASKRQVHINVDWHDEKTELVVPVKCLIDLMPDAESEFGDTLSDLKSTRSAAYRAWSRQVFSDGLHYQAALYTDAVNAATGLKYRNFEHIICENVAPFESTHRMLSVEFLQIGRTSYRRDLEYYCHCVAKQNFPGFDTAMVEPESYMISDS